MVVSTYYLKARLFPTILTSVPAVFLFNKYLSPSYHDELESYFELLSTLTDVALSSAVVFLLVQINRIFAKEIFQRFYFKNEIYMPTTNYLLKSSDFFESSIKERIENKINRQFGIQLLTVGEEERDELRARRLIATTVSQIRNVLRSNTLLLQHNIEYGFFRNLIGGSFLAFIMSIAIIIFSYLWGENSTASIGWVLSIIYVVPLILSKYVMNRYGQYYAKILYEQFLTIEEQ